MTLHWDAGGLSQVKKSNILSHLNKHDVDIFVITEANITEENKQYQNFKYYTTYHLFKFRQIVSVILIGIKDVLISKFKIMTIVD